MRLLTPVFVASLALAAAMPAQVVRDSAGVALVTYRNTPPAHAAFLVAGGPSLFIPGNAVDSTSFVGVTSMLRLRDRRIVIAVAYTRSRIQGRSKTAPPPNTQTFREIRVFDSTGAALDRLTDDSVIHLGGAVTYLAEPSMGVLFAAGGVPGWTEIDLIHRAPVVGFPRPTGFARGLFANGSVLTGRTLAADPARTIERDGFRVAFSPSTYERASATGMTGTISLPFRTEVPRALASGPNQNASAWPYTAPSVVSGPGTIWLFDPVKWELRLTDEAGRLRAVIKPPIPARLAKATLGARFPADSVYEVKMLTDERGRLWMDSGDNAIPVLNEFRPRVWNVFETDGNMLGSVVMPGGLRPMHVSFDELLGTFRPTRFDGTAVAVYRVRPP